MTFPSPIPLDDPRRLVALRSLKPGGFAPDGYFDGLARAAATICETPIAHVIVVDEHRQWFVGSIGMPNIRTSTVSCSFTWHLVATGRSLVVPDASRDARFAVHASMPGPQRVQFYAGAPLRLDGDMTLGAVCVVDHDARRLDVRQLHGLHRLAAAASREIRSRTGPPRCRFTEAPFDRPDPNRFAPHDRAETLLWADDLSVTTERLHEIVATVGPMRATIRAYVAAQRKGAAQSCDGPRDED